MRAPVTSDRIQRFMRALGPEAKESERVYFTGGATAVLLGWRSSTIDVDIKIVPEGDAIFRALPRLKEELQMNIELASPDQFIPELPGWRDRSPFIEAVGRTQFHHYDLYSQALAKIERAHDQDLQDVREMIARHLVEPPRAVEFFSAIEPHLYRYPAIDAASFRKSVEEFLQPGRS
jgi:hypothetical protein